MLKRPRSTHTVVYRPKRKGKPSKCWVLHYRNPKTGKFTEKSTGTTDRRAAQRLAVKLGEHLARMRDPLNIPRVRIDEWFEPERFTERLRRGLSRREKTIQNHIPKIRSFTRWADKQGLIYLDELKKGDVESFLTAERLRGLSPDSARQTLATIRLGLNLAIEDELLHENPSKGIRVAVPDRAPRIFTEFEIHKMLTQFKPTVRDFTRLVYYEALRVGEACHLRWEDVDLDRELIRIRGRNAAEEIKAWEPKSKAGTRVLPMRAKVKEILDRLYVEPNGNSPYVFPHLQKCRHPERQAQKQFRKECGRIGILPMEGKDPSLRDLRRSQLTELAHTLSPYELQSFAGHENPQTTSQYYVHLKSEDLGRRLAQLDLPTLYEDLYEKPSPSLELSPQPIASQCLTDTSLR